MTGKRTLFITTAFVVIVIIASFSLYWGLADRSGIDPDTIRHASGMIGLDFTDAEIDTMRRGLASALEDYRSLREIELDNSVLPALTFNPVLPGMTFDTVKRDFRYSRPQNVTRPENLEDAAFWPVTKLAELIRTRQVSSEELTRMYIERLRKYGPVLECVITITEDLALSQARRADREIAEGNYRGPLHGIPWGAKDLLATNGIKTTWGAMPYKDQVPDYDATVVKKLDEAGAVLVAKLTLGALAWGDVWYGGKTRNPWNVEQGSSGSSAGPAAATAAGLVGFAIGTETLGSIVSPATRCGNTGLRPTFGRVSRNGAMALSWSMDKIGPICRSAEDCALVLNEIIGSDDLDPTIVDLPFNYNSDVDIAVLRIGYVKSRFDRERKQKAADDRVLEVLRSLGVELIEFELPDFPAGAISFILNAEAAAVFDELTRSGRDELMVRQRRFAWPNSFRESRLIPAVEYINANRARTLLMQKMRELMENIDVYVSPTFGGSNLLVTNLTGHPQLVLPNGFRENGTPTSITFTGKLFGEAELLAVGKAYQDATDFHLKTPVLPD